MFVIPVEQLTKKPLEPRTLDDCFKLWDVEPYHCTKPLFILSGCSKKLKIYDKNKEHAEQLISSWLKFSQKYEHVIITNTHEGPEYLHSKPNSGVAVSLSPMYFSFTHGKNTLIQEHSYVITGKSLIEAANTAEEQVFFHDKNKKSIISAIDYDKNTDWDSEDVTVKRSEVRSADITPISGSVQEFIRYILRVFKKDSTENV